MTYKKNDYVTVSIEDMGSDGEGIGRVEGFTLFVKDAVVGDTVEARIVKCKKSYAYARLEKVIQPSPFRVEPKCPRHRACGGCQLQALSYEKQLEFKNRKIRNNLIHIGGFDGRDVDACMEPILGMEEPYHYRNKAQYPVGYDREGNLVTGFYAGRTHSIIANTDCCLGAPENEAVLQTVLEYMRANHVSAYDENTKKGLVRHILIRTGFTSGQIMVCLVINKEMTNASYKKARPRTDEEGRLLSRFEFLPNQAELLGKLQEIKEMTSVSVSVNTEPSNVIMGKEFFPIWGEPVISDTIHIRDTGKEGYPLTGQELIFKISPLSFYQVNPLQTEKLYSTALEYAGLTGRETVWDLYCGIGTISLFLAAAAKKVYGVEIVPQAIEDARENARRNGITNAEFFVGKVEEVLPEFYDRIGRQECQAEKAGEGQKETGQKEIGQKESRQKEVGQKEVGQKEIGQNEVGQKELGWQESRKQESDFDMLHPDVIVVDPPRKGCDAACLETMLKMQPQRIVYVSCDSATLARDLRVLCDGGYEIKRIRGCDMFPQTGHVETVCLLSKLNVEHHN